jgi:hypothetical protein
MVLETNLRCAFQIRSCGEALSCSHRAWVTGPGSRGGHDRDDTDQLQAELRDRLAQFALTLHPDKARLIQFGRRAADDRNQTGLGSPQTFDFLGSTMAIGLARHTP